MAVTNSRGAIAGPILFPQLPSSYLFVHGPHTLVEDCIIMHHAARQAGVELLARQQSQQLPTTQGSYIILGRQSLLGGKGGRARQHGNAVGVTEACGGLWG